MFAILKSDNLTKELMGLNSLNAAKSVPATG